VYIYIYIYICIYTQTRTHTHTQEKSCIFIYIRKFRFWSMVDKEEAIKEDATKQTYLAECKRHRKGGS